MTTAPTNDPYAAIRRLRLSRGDEVLRNASAEEMQPFYAEDTISGGRTFNRAAAEAAGWQYSEGDSGIALQRGTGQYGYNFDPRWRNDGALAPFASKYEQIEDLGNGRVRVRMQQPGAHKYDTMDAIYKLDPATGEYVMDGDPQARREVSSMQQMVHDPIDVGVKAAGSAAALYGAATGINALIGAATAAPTAAGAMAPLSSVPQMTVGSLGTLPELATIGPGVGGAATAGGAAAAAGGAGTAGATGAATAADVVAKEKAMGLGLSVSDWLGIGSVAAGLLNKPKTPDTSGINNAALDAQAMSREAFEWFKQEYAKTAPDRAAATARDNAIADAQVGAMNFATQEAKEAAARRKAVFDPLEDSLVADAKGYDTPARRAEAIARTTADIEGSVGRAEADNRRALARMSVTPDAATTAALSQDMALAKAKMIAGGTSDAVRNVEQQGYARKMDAAALGRNLPSNQATQQQIATQAGNAGVNAGAGAVNASQSGAPLMQMGTGLGIQGQSVAGQLYGQVANINAATRSQDLNFLGNAFNSYLRSSKKVKKGTGKPADGEQALEQIEATPVHKDWQYDTAKGGPDDGGQMHTGPMAEDVQATMGDGVAPGGKVIDMREMGGKLMAGMQTLAKKVEKMERVVARMNSGAAAVEA